jgi:hypothetical protein
MSAAQSKEDPISSEEGPIRRSWLGRVVTEKSPGATLIGLSVTLAAAARSGAMPGLCARCRGYRDPVSSTAQCPNVFCSRLCEQGFVHTTLASLTLEDCIRIQGRLEALLARVQEPAA